MEPLSVKLVTNPCRGYLSYKRHPEHRIKVYRVAGILQQGLVHFLSFFVVGSFDTVPDTTILGSTVDLNLSKCLPGSDIATRDLRDLMQ